MHNALVYRSRILRYNIPMPHFRHRQHIRRARHRYPLPLHQRVYTYLLAPLVVVAVVYVFVHFFPFVHVSSKASESFEMVLIATVYTMARLFIAYVLAILIAVPLSILATTNRVVEAILLPAFDILESVPILALFPVVIMVFINYFHSFNGAAIFIIFLSMLWNIVFTLVGGLNLIPADIIAAAEVFGVRGFAFIRRVILPALVPQLVTGSILALAQGWNIIIVAEVLHTYIPDGSAADDLFGLGSILVNASANAQGTVFVETVFVMVLVIGILNIGLWQRLLQLAQRFRFE